MSNPEHQQFEGPLVPLAWEAIDRGWEVSRDEINNILIEVDGERCHCSTHAHEGGASKWELGLAANEDPFVLAASVPVVDGAPHSRELLVAVRDWANSRAVPLGSPLVTPIPATDLHEDAVRVTVEYRVVGTGYDPQSVIEAIDAITGEVASLRETLEEDFAGLQNDAVLVHGFDVPLVTEGSGGEGELVIDPESSSRQIELFKAPAGRWRNAPIPVVPEVYRDLMERAKSLARHHDIDDATPMLLAKACALMNPAFFNEFFGEGSYKRVISLTRDDLNRGSSWNVRHILRRAADRNDPTAEMVPYVLAQLGALTPEMLEPITGENPDHQPGRGSAVSRPPLTRRPEKEQQPADADAVVALPSREELELALKNRVKGQDEAAEKVASRLAMTFRGLTGSSPRPKGVFMFAGPTGVGKTEMAKAIADTVYGPGENMIRLDMSEYSREHQVARLVGSPPAYIGHDKSGGWLTTRVRNNPRCVLLLDEFEKAHEVVWQAFLQVFEDGRLTDGQGKTVDFSQTVVVLTSNLGSRALAEVPATGFGQALGGDRVPDPSAAIMKAIREALPPELFNRIDGIFSFRPLDHELLTEIARAKLKAEKAALAEAGYDLKFSAAVARVIADFEADPALGARPLMRAIDRLIREPLADLAPGKYKVRASGGEVKVAA